MKPPDARIQKTEPPLPSLEDLTHGLGAALGPEASPVIVTHRRRNIQTSTFPSELLTCRLRDRSELHLFVKYADNGIVNPQGHRSGVAFEAQAYRDVLAPLPLTMPRYYGHFESAADRRTWLFLEVLDATSRVHKDPRPGAMARAAEWIGRFHALNESRASELAGWLHRYDVDYYIRWCRRTAAHAAGQDAAPAWLPDLCRRCETFLPEALSTPFTIIHGEYYPKNILTRDGGIYPVDWESLAVAPGEIDYASLMENWPDCDTTQACREAYMRARWPQGAPPDFQRRLAAAQMYWHFRWLGHRPQQQTWRHDSLRQLAEQLGIG